MSDEPVAVFDLGTNSTRLLVVAADGRETTRRATVTRLGDGVDASGRLSEAAIERTVDCLRAYQQICDAVGVRRKRAVATSAARDASNSAELFRQVGEVIGVEPDLLSGAEEGRVAFAGATMGLLPRLGPFGARELDLVIDIGGGSTELIAGVPGLAPEAVCSLDIGCVRLSERLLHGDPPAAMELSDAVAIVHSYFDDAQREIPIVNSATRLLGVAGSITTVAAIEIGLHTYDRDRIHHFVLTRDAVEDVFRTVATESRADRAFNPGLPLDRVGTIVAGVLILATAMRHFGFDTCTVSETDILDGLAAQLHAES